ncbi:MAG TPA: 4a-hydroxytetrahydrobiopterin dehydratase [Polyangia bacterium]|jgi:4a-hydroxytetrahydrobiopterin dehydratase|nr:4a-hydroxytetrahydrobiopterin dehydratase [Polyangia bacterium]
MAAAKDPPLSARRCVPCEGGTPPLDEASAASLLAEVSGWKKRSAAGKDGKGGQDASASHLEIHKRFSFMDFLGAMAFVDRMAALAEQEGHHPDFCVHYDQVDVTLWTHAVKGLSENDFILAAKIDAVVE